jgi:hypothetical protein
VSRWNMPVLPGVVGDQARGGGVGGGLDREGSIVNDNVAVAELASNNGELVGTDFGKGEVVEVEVGSGAADVETAGAADRGIGGEQDLLIGGGVCDGAAVGQDAGSADAGAGDEELLGAEGPGGTRRAQIDRSARGDLDCAAGQRAHALEVGDRHRTGEHVGVAGVGAGSGERNGVGPDLLDGAAAADHVAEAEVVAAVITECGVVGDGSGNAAGGPAGADVQRAAVDGNGAGVAGAKLQRAVVHRDSAAVGAVGGEDGGSWPFLTIEVVPPIEPVPLMV